MQDQLNVAIVQSPLVWENPEANRSYFSEKLDGMNADDVDLIVLPEMFTSGFTMNPAGIAESMDGETVKWLKKMAAEKTCAVTGSLVVEENGNFYNRLLFVLPSGEVRHYDKRHLFSLAGEHKVYTRGTDRLVVDFRGFRICPLVCYDLRFPAFARNTVDYDLLLFVANWPEPRIAAWDALLKARAIENVCYVVGVNRVGDDQNKHKYPGHSQVVDCSGDVLVSAWENEGVFTVVLEKKPLLECREKFSFLNDRDEITVA